MWNDNLSQQKISIWSQLIRIKFKPSQKIWATAKPMLQMFSMALHCSWVWSLIMDEIFTPIKSVRETTSAELENKC